MKKRLLSAALALAMVLTLLPATAFAATTTYHINSGMTGIVDKNGNDDSAGKTVTYQTQTDWNTGKEAGHWYYTATAAGGVVEIYDATGSGFIASNGTSGAWYASAAAYKAKVGPTNANLTFPSSFTLLGSFDMSSITAAGMKMPTSINVDVNGNTLTLPSALEQSTGSNDASSWVMTSITLTDKLHSGSDRGGLAAGITTARGGFNSKLGAMTINATNVKIPSINLVGRGNSVTLNNCDVSGGITMNGEYISAVNATTGIQTKSWPAQRLTATNKTSIGTSITITGDASSVQLTDTVGNAALNVSSNGGSVTIGGYSSIGAVKVKNRDGSTSAIPTVTVNGGTVGGIDNTDSITTASSTITVNRTTNDINITGAIATQKGTVSVTNANTQAITVQAGTLNIAGNNNMIGGMITMGAPITTGATLNITATNSTFSGGITNAGKMTIGQWPATRDNIYGPLALDSGTEKYVGKGIKGGTFIDAGAAVIASPNNMDWFDNVNLQFVVPVKNSQYPNTYALYKRTELTEAISDIAATTPADKTNPIIILGQHGGLSILQLNFGGNAWAYIKYQDTTPIVLPTRINNTAVAKWIVKNGPGVSPDVSGTSFTSGVTENIPGTGGTLILDSTDTAAEATKITNASIGGNANVANRNVKVTLNGNNINLSGAIVAASGGVASILVDLDTDVIQPNGQPQVITGVVIDYDVNTKKVSFNSIQPSISSFGAIVQNGELVLNRGTGAHYTVSANLSVSATNLNLYTGSTEIQATLGGKVSGFSPAAKENLIKQIEGGQFIWSGNKAMLEAINAAQATITANNTVQSWIDNAQNTIWKNGFTSADGGTTLTCDKHTGNFKDFMTYGPAGADVAKITGNFTAAYIVPYLVVNVTDYSESGTLTATLTPYYRVDVSGGAYNPNVAYTVQAGRTLGALTGDMSTPITVYFNFTSGNFTGSFMHQDGKYVYPVGAPNSWSIYHAGTTGLGTIEINKTAGAVSFPTGLPTAIAGRNPALPAYTYDALQAAIDDTVPGWTQANDNTLTNAGCLVSETYDTILIDGSYKGSCDINMTGASRKVVVQALGNLPIKSNSKDVEVLNPSGYTYVLQLKRDAVIAGTVALVAQGTVQGTVSLSATSAKVGETVVVTVVPNAGQTATGVTVRTNSGTIVPATATGRLNEYSFVVPTGATSITVTPNFGVSASTQTVVSVGSAAGGSAYTSAIGSDNKVVPGSTVTVTAVPNSGYRSMGITARTNTGATVAATRTSANTWSVVVPTGATIVTVTPNFDVNNGTPFTDVLSSHWASKEVSWAYQNKYVDGTGTYTYSPATYITRGEVVAMLWKAEGKPVVSYVNPFKDVPSNYWAYDAVMWAASKGLIDTSTGSFNPTGYATRAEVVTILYKRANSPAVYGSSGFADVASNAAYAKAVTWAKQSKLTNGYGGSTYFRPGYAISRAEVATFLYRAFA